MHALAEKHYKDLSKDPFFIELVGYIVSGPVVAMIWEGKNVMSLLEERLSERQTR
ncbi:hypothetical protein GIB67_039445 [Kingdonia uniflora]|uniref:nucleoside-diphosphate kinase n=1 Tax=Kingdonia uniflora TaxID=39325 RepID=A0A7J7LIH8_9MAGN|nr:hypothetical protein GIB67_039445 [Kingdonia uniflora]